ncbi:IS3 family transposase [Metabacillus sp. RGM 3146]|uniref:IS3 family transposase n=1 Tax=Metabacillus sp. RGM 3146 TaxID=3401092 RepID=UPI003B990732
MKLKQSMSRRGNCIDNASMESFFGTLKDWVEHKKCQTFQELKDKVNAFIYMYNSERYQWDLLKMTPAIPGSFNRCLTQQVFFKDCPKIGAQFMIGSGRPFFIWFC